MNPMSPGRIEALAQPLFRGTHTKPMSWTGKPGERDGQTVEVWTEPSGTFRIEVHPCMGRVRGTTRLFVRHETHTSYGWDATWWPGGHFLNLEGAQARAERVQRLTADMRARVEASL